MREAYSTKRVKQCSVVFQHLPVADDTRIRPLAVLAERLAHICCMLETKRIFQMRGIPCETSYSKVIWKLNVVEDLWEFASGLKE